jgi:hypothetical protein
LLALDAEDRYLRFGYPASDEQIRRYVDQLDDRDDIFGIYNRRSNSSRWRTWPMRPCPSMRTAPSSVFGGALCTRAWLRGAAVRPCRHARAQRGCAHGVIHALSENTAMLRIAATPGPVSAMAPNPKPICSCRPPIWTPA